MSGYGVLVLLLKSFSISPKEVEAEKTGATGKVRWILVRSGLGWVGGLRNIVVSIEEHLTLLYEAAKLIRSAGFGVESQNLHSG